ARLPREQGGLNGPAIACCWGTAGRCSTALRGWPAGRHSTRGSAGSALLAGGDCEGADAQAGGPGRGPAPEAARRPAGGAAAEPAAAPEHPGRAPRLEVILAPLPDVAVHVVDAEPVRFIPAHLGGPLEVPGLGRVARGVIAVEVGLFGGEVVG